MGSKQTIREEEEELTVVDDLLRQRAVEADQPPLFAYPRTDTGLTSWDTLTANELDQFTNAAVQALRDLGFDPAPVESFPMAPVVGLLGHSTLDYVINMFALSRLGYTVLLLSPRMPLEAYRSMTKDANCDAVLYGPTFQKSATGLELKLCKPLVRRDRFDSIDSLERFHLQVLDKGKAANRVAYIIHSSGSTGTPKLLRQIHAACLGNYKHGGWETRCLHTAPFYHTHGSVPPFLSSACL